MSNVNDELQLYLKFIFMHNSLSNLRKQYRKKCWISEKRPI